jgi:hypothetical protein
MRILQQRPFSMLEAVIALGLTAMLMTMLSYFYLQMDQITYLTEQSLRKLYQLAYVENRLATVLPKAVAENTARKDFFFFTTSDTNKELFSEGTSLIFTYDNGIDLEKRFSNHVLGRLFVDPQQRLVLATWPSPMIWKEDTPPPIKKEILLENVEKLRFAFFVAPDVDRIKLGLASQEVKERQIYTPEPSSWIPEWRYQYYQLPAIISIDILQHTGDLKSTSLPREIHFEFPLPNSPQAIFYTK